MRVLGFGTYDVRAHPRVGVLLDGLRSTGHEVIEANVPLGLDTAARVALLRHPERLWMLVVRLLRCWLVLGWRARRQGRAAPLDVILVGYLGHFDVLLARLLFPRTPIVLDHLISAADTARDRGQTGSVLGWLLRALDAAALACADLVVLDTDEHAALLPARYRSNALVVPVGAPAVWGAARAALPASERDRRGPLRVVFFGAFTPLQGAPVLGAALARLAGNPAVTAVLIGTGQDWDATRAAAAGNVQCEWRNWVDPDDLPEVVAGADVCLGIFGRSAKALRVVPNKVYQGAAAGCAIITSDTPPQRRALGDAAVFLPPGDPGALAAALAQLAADRAGLVAYRQAAARRADAAFRPQTVVAPLAVRLATLARAVR